jgi:peptidoglycan/LPS O-acetylase OafA/YrhL
MTYLPFVDGLRAVAILAVVAFHAAPSVLPGGFAGVDVFFVISGFLITRLIVLEIEAGHFSLSRFFVRRARRLAPAALFCFAIVTGLSAAALLPDAFWQFGRSLLAAVLMYANIFFADNGGYFSAPALEKPLLHTWSLSLEDQFYLTWPILLLLTARRFSRASLIALAAAIAVGSFALAEYFLVRDPDFAFFQLPTRAWELLVGAILALIGRIEGLSSAAAEAFSLAGAAAVVASFMILNSNAHFPGLGAALPCFGTAAIIAAGSSQPTAVARLLSLRPVVFVGLISYSLYLWHWPLISLASYRLERPLDFGEAAAVVAASFAIAVASWRYVERPFRHGHHVVRAARLSEGDKRFAFGAFGGLLSLVAVAMAIKIGKGFPQRYDAEIQTVLEQAVAGNPMRRACDDHQNIFRNDNVCNAGRKLSAGESYEVALFGDSMANHWAPMLVDYAEKNNLAFRQVTNGGCGLFFGVDLPTASQSKARDCRLYQLQAARFVDANPGLKLAVIAGYWNRWLERLETGAVVLDRSGNEQLANLETRHRSKFDAALRQTIEAFTSRGVKVLLIGQAPVYQSSLPLRCIISKIQSGEDVGPCGLPRIMAEAQLRESDKALRRAAQGNPAVSVSLPSSFICQKDFCSLIADGTMLYRDYEHLNRFGARALGAYIQFPSLN